MSKRFLRAAKVADRYNVTPKTIREWDRNERFAHLGFPKSIPISDGVVAWDADELDAWDSVRKAMRDQNAAA